MSEWCGWPVVDETTGWEQAQKILADAELSDGLPLVPPTMRRLEAMVAGERGSAAKATAAKNNVGKAARERVMGKHAIDAARTTRGEANQSSRH